MSILECIRSVVAGFVVPVFLILIGVFTTVFWSQGPEPSSDRQLLQAAEGRVHIRDHGDAIQMHIDVAPGEVLTTLVLTNFNGRKPVKLIASHSGALVLESDSEESGPTRFLFYLGPNGSISLGCMNKAGVGLKLRAPLDGSSEFVVESREGRRRARVGPKGELSFPQDGPDDKSSGSRSDKRPQGARERKSGVSLHAAILAAPEPMKMGSLGR